MSCGEEHIVLNQSLPKRVITTRTKGNAKEENELQHNPSCKYLNTPKELSQGWYALYGRTPSSYLLLQTPWRTAHLRQRSTSCKLRTEYWAVLQTSWGVAKCTSTQSCSSRAESERCQQRLGKQPPSDTFMCFGSTFAPGDKREKGLVPSRVHGANEQPGPQTRAELRCDSKSSPADNA